MNTSISDLYQIGPQFPTNDVIIAINWVGVSFISDQEKILVQISFAEIISIGCPKYSHCTFIPKLYWLGCIIHCIIFLLFFFISSITVKGALPTFVLATVRGEEFVFRSNYAKDICELVDHFSDGLKKRSQFCVALQNFKGSAQLNSCIILPSYYIFV